MVHLKYPHNVYELQDMLEQRVHRTIDTKQVRFRDRIQKKQNEQHTGPTQLTRTLARAHISTNDF